MKLVGRAAPLVEEFSDTKRIPLDGIETFGRSTLPHTGCEGDTKRIPLDGIETRSACWASANQSVLSDTKRIPLDGIETLYVAHYMGAAIV